MKSKTIEKEETETLAKGILRRTSLPSIPLGELWHSIITEDQLKSQLLSQAILNFTIRGSVARTILPLHGIILLVGKPGTGKTSLAKGLAHRTAASFEGSKFHLLEVEPHALASSAMGKTQRAVTELFSQSIAESASNGPTIVLLDEVETLAADRSRMSLEANPIDIHRATDAVLVQLDELAERFPQLLFIATSNFPEAVDEAFTSRCDLVMQVPLPNKDACRRILMDCLSGLGKAYPAIAEITSTPNFDQIAAECVGMDGRTIRKMVANALASTPETAMDPNKVNADQLFQAARSAKINRTRETK